MNDTNTTKSKALGASSWLLDTAESLKKGLSEPDRAHWVEHAIECVKAVYGPLAPFQVGDRVVLKDPPGITHAESWGWVGHERNLAMDKRGEIVDVSWSATYYKVLFQPDAPTFVSSDGTESPMGGEPPVYALAARRFVKEFSGFGT